MRFRTEIGDVNLPFTINPRKSAILLGSCFADYIGDKLINSFWQATVNPFGTLFNPMSIANAMDIALGKRGMKIDNINDRFIPWDFSTLYEGSDSQEVARRCTRQSELLRESLAKGDVLIVTFGTSIVYELCADKSIVANCHKQPQKLFSRRSLSIDEITDRWVDTIKELREINPDIKIILSVSPVRHLADGFTENNRSKARLLLACENIVERDASNLTSYFPSFEIVCDDLRDYRFYTQDLVHPSPMAVDYIWEKFCNAALDESGKRRVKEGEKLHARATHRLQNPDSAESKEFLKKTRELINEFLSESEEG